MSVLTAGLLVLATATQVQFRPLDAELKAYTYPYPVQFYRIKSQRQDLRMAYMDVKATSPNGKTVVLLHGKNFGGSYWQRTIADLSKAGYRVIAPDQIGFGKSSKPDRYQFSFHTMATHTSELLISLGVTRYMVVGHSMGGMLATRLTLMFPQAVAKLALVNPIGLEDYRSRVPYRTVDQIYAQELKANEQSIRDYQRQAYFAGNWKPEYDKLIEVAVGWTLHKDYPKIAWNSALTSDMIYTQPVVQEFPNLKAPTLLIVGTRDRTAIGKDRVPKEQQEELGRYEKLGKVTASTIPGSKLVEIEGVGHMPQVEAYDRYLAALSDFLGS